MTILQTEALTRRYGSLTAVDALTFSLEAGEIFGLLGPNGAGKTTVIKMLTTLLRAVVGYGRGGGVRHHPAGDLYGSVIGYVPQLLSADGTLTG